MKKDDAIKLLKGDYGRQIYNIACSYIAPIFWISSKNKNIHHGTIFFLDCGCGPFAVTADHVYRGYLESKRLDPFTRCQIENISFIPEKHLIDRDENLDIATFSIDRKDFKADGKLIHETDCMSWPPRPPDVGKGIFFAGYPKEFRTSDTNKINFSPYLGILTATRVNDERVVCKYERSEIVNMFGTAELPNRQNLDGLSGSPLWTLVETDIVYWRLGGIIYEFNPEYELLFARRPDCILADGRIKKNQIV